MYDRYLRILFIVLILGGNCCVRSGSLHPKAVSLNNEGVKNMKEGDYKAARAAFILSLEYNPDFSEPYNNLGIVAMKQGDYKGAEEFFAEAIKLNPDFAEAWNNMGVLRMRMGMAKEGMECFMKALESNPGHIEARINFADSLIKEGELEEAETEVLKVLALDGDNLVAHVLLADIRIRQKDFERAKAVLNEVLDKKPDFPEGLLLMAKLYVELKLLDQAQKFLEKLDYNVPEQGLWTQIGAVNLAAGNCQRAYFYFSRALEVNRNDPYAVAGMVLHAGGCKKDGDDKQDKIKEICKLYRSLDKKVSNEAETICARQNVP